MKLWVELNSWTKSDWNKNQTFNSRHADLVDVTRLILSTRYQHKGGNLALTEFKWSKFNPILKVII